MAHEYWKKLLECTWTTSEQLIKIQPLLLLIFTCENEKEKENYFYKAIELLHRYIVNDLQNNPEWKKLISLYISHIDPSHPPIREKFPESYLPLLWPMISTEMISEHKRRIQEKINWIEDIVGFSCKSIPEKLHEIFGPMRILIISEISNEVFMSKWEWWGWYEKTTERNTEGEYFWYTKGIFYYHWSRECKARKSIWTMGTSENVYYAWWIHSRKRI